MAKSCRKLKWLVFFWDTVYFYSLMNGVYETERIVSMQSEDRQAEQ